MAPETPQAHLLHSNPVLGARGEAPRAKRVVSPEASAKLLQSNHRRICSICSPLAFTHTKHGLEPRGPSHCGPRSSSHSPGGGGALLQPCPRRSRCVSPGAAESWLPGSSGASGTLTSGSGMTSGGGGGGAGGALTGVVDSGVSNASSESELLMEREGGTHRVRWEPGPGLLSHARPPDPPAEPGWLPD